MVTVTYSLSEKGQKEDIRRGGNGYSKKSFETPLTEELLEIEKEACIR